MFGENKDYSFKTFGKSYEMVTNERGYSAKLSLLGKLCYFCEYFEGIIITKDDIFELVPIDYAIDTLSFKDGYDRAMALVKNGFNEKNYNDFLKSIRHSNIQMKISLKRNSDGVNKIK